MEGWINGPACVPTHLRRGLLGVELEGERGEVETVWIVGFTETLAQHRHTIINHPQMLNRPNPKPKNTYRDLGSRTSATTSGIVQKRAARPASR